MRWPAGDARFSLRALRSIDGVPRIALLLGIPAAAFVLSVGLGLAKTGGSSGNSSQSLQVAVQRALPTSTPVTPPTATPPPYRTDCAAIAGTSYQSPDERAWYLANCNGSQQITGAGAGGGIGATTASVSRRAIETSLGDRLVIEKIGVNAPVSRTSVGGDGVMPDPTGYFNAVLYDFAAIPGLGGAPGGGGNAVFAGHVDCAACGPGGSPGAAVFYYMRNLAAGDVIEYYTQAGAYYRYVVTYVADLPPDADWASIVSAGSADMTLITCSGVFQSAVHEYTTRRVVQARKG